MKLPDFIEKAIVKLLLTKSGPALQKGISAAIAFIITRLATTVPGIEAYITPELLLGLLWFGIDYLITLLPADIIKTYGEALQKALNKAGGNVTVDGYVGPKTIKAATGTEVK